MRVRVYLSLGHNPVYFINYPINNQEKEKTTYREESMKNDKYKNFVSQSQQQHGSKYSTSVNSKEFVKPGFGFVTSDKGNDNEGAGSTLRDPMRGVGRRIVAAPRLPILSAS